MIIPWHNFCLHLCEISIPFLRTSNKWTWRLIKWTWRLIKQQSQIIHFFLSPFLGRCVGRLVRCSKFILNIFSTYKIVNNVVINMFDFRCRCQTGLLFNEYKILLIVLVCYSYRILLKDLYMYRYKHMCIGKLLFFRSNYFRNNLQCDWPRNVDCKRYQPSQFSQPPGLTTQSQWELLPTTPSSVSGLNQQSDVQTCKDSESTACRSLYFMFPDSKNALFQLNWTTENFWVIGPTSALAAVAITAHPTAVSTSNVSESGRTSSGVREVLSSIPWENSAIGPAKILRVWRAVWMPGTMTPLRNVRANFFLPYNSVQYNAVPYNTIQYNASWLFKLDIFEFFVQSPWHRQCWMWRWGRKIWAVTRATVSPRPDVARNSVSSPRDSFKYRAIVLASPIAGTLVLTSRIVRTEWCVYTTWRIQWAKRSQEMWPCSGFHLIPFAGLHRVKGTMR